MRRSIVALVTVALVVSVLPGTASASRRILATPNATMGSIGCSNTVQAVNAYTAASSEDQLFNTARWGTSLEQWASPRNQRPWAEYDAQRPSAGYVGTFLNLCARVSKRSGLPTMTQAHVDAVLAKIWERDPGIPVYVSALNSFTDEGCPTSGGNAIPELGAVLAAATVAAYPLVEAGPVLGPIEGSPCHLTSADEALIGSQMVAFFDQ